MNENGSDNLADRNKLFIGFAVISNLYQWGSSFKCVKKFQQDQLIKNTSKNL
jgi:hypothetical protein